MIAPIRAAAALVLAFQLHQLALPALCGSPERSATRCHGTQPPGAPQLVGQGASDELLCSSRAMCGMLATAIPEVAITLTASAGYGAAAPVAQTLLPGDPAPPLSPPPQA